MKNHRTILWVAPPARFCGAGSSGSTTIANVNPSPSLNPPPHVAGLAQPERAASGIHCLAIPIFNKGKEPVTVDRTTIRIPVADKDRNFMLELSSIPSIRNTCSDEVCEIHDAMYQGNRFRTVVIKPDRHYADAWQLKGYIDLGGVGIPACGAKASQSSK